MPPTSHERRGLDAPFFALSFGAYSILLVMMTLFKNRMSLGGLWQTSSHQYRSIDLQLFNGFDRPALWWAPWVDTLGNVALFLPLGFFVYQALRHFRRSRFSFIETVLFAGLTSLVIELLQWVFAIGFSDVDDLLCNTVGGLIGATIAVVSSSTSRRILSAFTLAGSLIVMAIMVHSAL